MEHRQCDVAVIGAGPAGYVAAIRLGQLGRKVVVIERNRPGGVCLNWGCIPVKALLHAAGTLRDAAESRARGIVFGRPEIDLIAMYAWKSRIVDRLVKGIEFLLRNAGAVVVKGTARFSGLHELIVSTTDGEATIVAKHIIVATGSEPSPFPTLPVDNRTVLDSNGALNLVSIPSRLAIVGAGVVGLEFATFFNRLGTRVVVLELLGQILPGVEPDITSILQRQMHREGIEFHVGARVTGLSEGQLRWTDVRGDHTAETDLVLVATGRQPITTRLGLEPIGVSLSEDGFIRTDERYRTDADGVYAVGDVRGGPLLAHKAMAEGLAVAEVIAGGRPRRFQAIPSCVYTDPEVAVVGLSECDAREQGRSVKVVRVPVSAVGRSLTLGRSDGFCRMVVDAETDRVLGVALIAPQADVLIAEGAVAVELGLRAADIGRVVHPHPTMSELLFEAAEAVHGRAVHILNT